MTTNGGLQMMKNINYANVTINGGFWKEKQDMIKNITAMAVYDRFQDTHRFEALKCQWKEGDPNMPHIFWDSDVAKWIEGAAYLLGYEHNDTLEALVEEAIGDIIRNSDENGYFNSHFLVTEQEKRFQLRDCHELYCAGHLMEAAVAYYEATGKKAFLDVMCKYADYIEKVFKIEKSAAFITPGHPELELALVKLADCTGEKRYMDLAKYFIDEHGKHETEKDYIPWATWLYNQDEMLLRDRSTVEGHSVRAMYLLAAAADIAAEYGDNELKAACERCFDNAVNKRMYITGGLGSTHIGEAFTADYHLPNRTSYTETCAAIALALFAQRMLKLSVKAEYADIVEKVIYNGALSGVSLDGKGFFYENPLEIDPEFNNIFNSTVQKKHYAITQRVEVFDCSCCPPNILRFISSIAGLMFTGDEDTVYVHQYMNAEAEFEGTRLTLNTEYPVCGEISIKCATDKKQIALRIPGWCRNFSLDCDYEVKDGYAYIAVDGEAEIVLTLEMPVRAMRANRRVHDDAGRVAIMRGPVVYCAEGLDNGPDVKGIFVDTKAGFELGECDFLVPSVLAKGYRAAESDQLYMLDEEEVLEEISVKLIPYFAYANRETTEMQVWLLKK